jgi:PKD repeat protein
MWDDKDLQITADEIGYRTHTFFGRRDHDTGRAMGRIHNDLDIYFPVGIPHYAPFKGTVAGLSPLSIKLRWGPQGRTGTSYYVAMGHISKSFKKPGDPVQAGEKVALSGDKRAGSIPHTHARFIEAEKDDQSKFRRLNLWWLIWQGFENERIRRGLTRACMRPLSPVKAGKTIAFSSKGSAAAKGSGALAYYWDFGDSSISSKANPKHRYDGPGIYQVRLTVSDLNGSHKVTQYITVDGPDKSHPRIVKIICPVQNEGTSSKLIAVFSERVEKGKGLGGAENPRNYRIINGPAVSSVTLLPNQSMVGGFTESSLDEAKEYKVAVSGVKDLAGNPVKGGSTVSFHTGKQIVLQPAADAEVFDHKDHADSNFGKLPNISIRAGRGRFSPWPNHGNNKFGYMRFRIPVNRVTVASIRFFILGKSSNAFYVVPLKDEEWNEETITFSNAPDLYSPQPLGMIQGQPEGWHELDVTDYVNRCVAADHKKNICFGLRAVANDARVIRVDTREGKHPPELIVRYRKSQKTNINK